MSLDALLRLHLPFALKRTKKLLRNSLAGYALALSMSCGSVASSPADAGSTYDPGINRADASLAEFPDGATKKRPEIAEGIYVTPDTGEVVSEVIDGQEVFYARGKVLIKVPSSTKISDVEALANDFSGEISGYLIDDSSHWYELQVTDARETLPRLQKSPLVEITQLNYARRLNTLDIENWEGREESWGFYRIRLPEAYELIGDRGLAEVMVAIIDSSFDLEHNQEMSSRFLRGANGGLDFADVDGDPSHEDVMRLKEDGRIFNKLWYHGTMVSGIIAMENNGSGLNGVAYQADILPIKVSSSHSTERFSLDFKIATAIRYATNRGADIINISMGNYDMPSPILGDKIEYAIERDVSVVAAVGNDCRDAGDAHPSAHPEVISVGAINQEGGRAVFSNYSPDDDSRVLTIAAPGENIFSSFPHAGEPYIRRDSGTSYAAPFVSGTLALLKSLRPSLSRSELKQILLDSAEEIEVSYPPDASWKDCPDNWSPGTGGRTTWKVLNAYRAVALALGNETSEEVCDGLDNDYDGIVDDNLTPPSRECSAGIGECRGSGLEYRVCEGEADWSADYRNCDAVAGESSVELCDESDHDCDGDNYNGFNVGEECIAGTGECFALGNYECSPDGLGTQCNALSGIEEDEICDGLDNDCDGISDNNLVPSSQVCSAGVGECQRSGLEERVCEGAAGWSADYRDCDAVAGVLGEEICNELDDDCDGVVDDECEELVSELRVIQIGAGNTHTCALLAGGAVRCYGRNWYGQLGDGSGGGGRYSVTPTPVFGLENVTQITGGWAHTCALLEDGAIRCWGHNGYSQLGDGTTTVRYSPTPVSGLNDVAQIRAGGSLTFNGRSHTCALLADGAVQCWGNNDGGQLGDGTIAYRAPPTPVSELTNVVQIALGGGHTCALLADATARCWGYNSIGQLGDGMTTNHYTPTPVSELTNATQIALGNEYTCALLVDGAVRCWGNNIAGQLGDGTTTNHYNPTPVSELTNVVQIALGGNHTCALIDDGTVRCWGYNYYGQLGDGTTTDRYTPTPVSELTNVIQIALGSSHTCALLVDGAVRCWGGNDSGQLGDGTTTDRYTPTEVVW